MARDRIGIGRQATSALLLAISCASCGTTNDAEQPPTNEGPLDASAEGSIVDARPSDASVVESSVVETSVSDTSVVETSVSDTAVLEASVIDGTSADSELVDAPSNDSALSADAADAGIDAPTSGGGPDAEASSDAETASDAEGGVDAASDAPDPSSGCEGGAVTTIVGKVYAPNGVDPINAAIVYVPGGQVQPLSTTPWCDQCGSALTGSPLVTTLSGPDGSFTLAGVPDGPSVPLVIQLGKWRRQLSVSVAKCATTTVAAASSRLPRMKAEGDIPKIAVVTGAAEATECALRKIGISDSEFTNSGGAGRVHLYRSNGAFLSSTAAPGYDPISALTTSPAQLASYDMVLFGCEGGAFEIYKTDAMKLNLRQYAAAGGRILTSHYGYAWLYNFPPFSQTAPWNVDQPRPTTVAISGVQAPLTGKVDVSFPKGLAFSKWLDVVAASTAPGSNAVSIADSRHDVDDVVIGAAAAPWPASYSSRRWLYSDPSANPAVPKGTVQQLTFNAPVGLPVNQQCGRVAFADSHVTTAPYLCNTDAQCVTLLGAGSKCLCYSPANSLPSCACPDPGNPSCQRICSQPFPSECSTMMSPDERRFEFMFFDLAACVQDDNLAQPKP